MAYSDSCIPVKSRIKRKKQPLFIQEQQQSQEEHGDEDRDLKKIKLCKTWENLDLILTLQSKEIHLRRKIKACFDFAGSEASEADGQLQPVSFSRALRYVFDWMQSLLMYTDRNRKGIELVDPCLDYRCWVVIRFCSEKISSGASPNLLRAVNPVLKQALLVLDANSLSSVVESIQLFENVLQCLSSLLASNSRAFHNVGVDLWISCTADVLNIITRFTSKKDQGSSVAKVLLDLSSLLLQHFSSFLRFHPNPRNIFRVFVERLLEHLFELLVLLQLRTKDACYEQFISMMKTVEDVMLNGLFHPAHISGFWSSRISVLGQEVKSRGSNESYHRHLFQKLEEIILDKKVTALGGLPCLLRLLATKLKGQNGASMSFRGHNPLKKCNKASGDAQEASMPLFEVFMQFMKPLLQVCKLYAEKEFSRILPEDSEHKFIELHCMLRSLNEILKIFFEEKIYIRTEDSSEGKHYCFLKDIYDVIYSISIKMQFFCWSEIKIGDEAKKLIPLMAREMVVGVGYFLEIEYRVFGEDLAIVWLMLLSYLAVNVFITDNKPCFLLMNEILDLGCRIICVYNELRQVNTPLFALCKAVRFFIYSSDNISYEYKVFSSSIQSSQLRLKAAKALLCSQELRFTIANAVKSVPEGQAGNCIQQLNLDIAESLEWMRHNSFSVDDKTSNINMLDMDIKAEIFGRILTEMFATVLDSLRLTATNSISIGNSLKNLIKTLRPSLSCFLQVHSNNVNDYVFSITGRNLSKPEFMGSVCWLFIFFFRLYASSRSLYRQSISLMPPDSSRKASESLGDLFTASCYMDWMETPEKMDEGYFSWIAKPSISLIEAIKFLSVDFLSSGFSANAPLVYILLVIIIQRLGDLNRLIKAFDFIHKKETFLQLQGDITSNKSIKIWEKLAESLRKEAEELTNFMMGYLSLFDSKGLFGKFDDDEWDYGVCSLDEDSLCVAVWRLFCQNTDVWYLHSTKKHRNKFFLYLFLYSLPCLNNDRCVLDGKAKGLLCRTVTLNHISLEFFGDTILWEQMITYMNVSSSFCGTLKKLLSPILSHTPANNIDLASLPNWAELLNILEKSPVRINGDDGINSQNGSSFSESVSVLPMTIYLDHSKSQPPSSFSLILKACENLLNMFCKMPRFHVNTKSFLRYSSYMINIERLLLSNLLNHYDESFTYDPLELLRLFLSCRRAIKFLVMGYGEKFDVTESRSICIVFDCPSSLLWLFNSVYEVCGLPNAFFGGKYSSLVQEMIYSLIDHTSYVFLKISEAKATLLFLSKGIVGKDEISQNHPNLNGDYGSPLSLKPCDDWDHMELIAEALKEHAEKFFATFKSCAPVKLNASSDSSEWNRLSCIISCFQSLLVGLTSASDRISKEKTFEVRQISCLVLHCVSKLSSLIAAFENLINLCLNWLILENSQVAEDVFSAEDDNLIFDCVERVMKLHKIVDTANFSCCSNEHIEIDNVIIGREIKSCEPASASAGGKVNTRASTIRKRRSSSSRIKWAIDFLNLVKKIDFPKFKISCQSLLHCLLKDATPQVAFLLRHLFITSATILRLKCMPSRDKHSKNHPHNAQSFSSSTALLFGISYIVLQELFEMNGQLSWLSFAWLDGVLTFFDVIGSLFSYIDPSVSKDVYSNLIDLHLKAMGKCISLQGRTEALALEHEKFNFDVVKTKLRISLKKYIMIPSEVYLKMVIQIIERNLVAVRKDYAAVYRLSTGTVDAAMVSYFAASIECFEMILDCFSGNNQFLKKSMPNLVGAIINIVLHLQNSSIYYAAKSYADKSEVPANAGAVIFMCVEVLSKVVGRSSFHMDPCYVSQYFHIPMALFGGFHKLRASCVNLKSSIFSCEKKDPLASEQLYVVDRQFSVELYTSCCRLLCSTIKHRKCEAERCISLLEESLNTLLSCLEVVDSDTAKREGGFSWEPADAMKCASFLRRIYEEIRHQKDVLGKYAYLILSNYISTFTGSGPAKAGIRREIDEALRPGVYSLIDICTHTDLQQIHTLLSESSARTTLANLLHDYQQNFHYEGKI